MLKMLTDEQLNPMRRGAPLLAEEYRKLRERMTAATALMAAANKGLQELREAFVALQTRPLSVATDDEVRAEVVRRGFPDAGAFAIDRDAALAERDALQAQLDDLRLRSVAP